MNRRSFFKFLGIGAATAAVAPKMLAEDITPRDGQYFVGIDVNKDNSACWAIVRNGKIIGVNIIGSGRGVEFSESYDDMMEKVVLTIDRELKRGAA
jgi:hypothetical protein